MYVPVGIDPYEWGYKNPLQSFGFLSSVPSSPNARQTPGSELESGKSWNNLDWQEYGEEQLDWQDSEEHLLDGSLIV